MKIDDLNAVSPALQAYTKDVLLANVWQRPQLQPRDRSIITIAALIARGQGVEMEHHFHLALENGLAPSELGEVITHLAFYSGWGNATLAAAIAKDVFAHNGIATSDL